MKRVAPLLVFALVGCVSTATPVPMTSVRDELRDGPAKCLVVFLPGVGDEARDFEHYGFIEALREKGLSVDVVAADATLGYYVKAQVITRLEEDVIGPARAKGYAQTWLVGISMGGMGAIRYASERPDQVTGIFTLAPFLGSRELSNEIRAGGGLAKWKAPEKSSPMSGEEAELQLWRWLQAATTGDEQGTVIYTAYGTEDRFAPQVALMADALPSGHTFTMKGGHRWATWRPLFGAFLSDSDFTRGCSR